MASRFWLKRRRAGIISTHELIANGGIATLTVAFAKLLHSMTAATLSWSKFMSTTLPSTFCHLISNIVLVRAKKQMFRVLTNRIIAMVENVHIFWDTAISKLPTKAVSRNTLIINTNLPVFTFPGASLTQPRPTLIGFTKTYILPVSILRSAIQWVTMSKPSVIVQETPFSSSPRSSAIWYCTTIPFISHIFNIPQHRGVI